MNPGLLRCRQILYHLSQGRPLCGCRPMRMCMFLWETRTPPWRASACTGHGSVHRYRAILHFLDTISHSVTLPHLAVRPEGRAHSTRELESVVAGSAGCPDGSDCPSPTMHPQARFVHSPCSLLFMTALSLNYKRRKMVPIEAPQRLVVDSILAGGCCGYQGRF